MKLGISHTLIIIYFLSINLSFSEEKITSSPLLNLNEIKPSFEELDEDNDNISPNQNLKEKNNVLNFEEKIDELNQETESLIEEIDKWEM